MITVLQNRKVKSARKEYRCQSSEFLRDVLSELRSGKWFEPKLTFSEWRDIATAKSKGWKILKGDPYLYQFNNYDGDTYTFRCIEAIHNICVKHDLYPED